MTSKERVLRNYTFQRVDHFTIDFCAESKVYELLRNYYGARDDLELMETLHVDFRYPKPEWIGFPLVDEQGRRTDYFGIPRGGAGDFGYALEHPLAHVRRIEELDEYPKWPSPDMWDYDRYAEDCARFEEYAVLGGVWGWFFEAACELVGMDRFFLLMYDQPELAHAILERIVSFMEQTSEIMFDKAGKYIDICFTGDDYGFQTGPMMSPAMFDQFVRPYLQRIYDVGRRHGKLIMH
ncbi:MAG: uroporphyrinogen decarboxylase family protein, partial [Bryobacteraceae bacterium]